jgi:hypothetical protein
MTRDDWLMSFVDVLLAAGRPKKLARQVALAESVNRSGDDPAKAAREWLKKQTAPKGKKP